MRAKEAHLSNLTIVGPWSRDHTEWDNDYVSSTQRGLIAKAQGVPNALVPRKSPNTAVNSEWNGSGKALK